MQIHIRNVNWSSKTWSTCTQSSLWSSCFRFVGSNAFLALFHFQNDYCVLVFPTSFAFIRYYPVSVFIVFSSSVFILYSQFHFFRLCTPLFVHGVWLRFPVALVSSRAVVPPSYCCYRACLVHSYPGMVMRSFHLVCILISSSSTCVFIIFCLFFSLFVLIESDFCIYVYGNLISILPQTYLIKMLHFFYSKIGLFFMSKWTKNETKENRIKINK